MVISHLRYTTFADLMITQLFIVHIPSNLEFHQLKKKVKWLLKIKINTGIHIHHLRNKKIT